MVDTSRQAKYMNHDSFDEEITYFAFAAVSEEGILGKLIQMSRLGQD